MIKIHKETKFKLIDYKPIEFLTEDGRILLDKYKCFYNIAIGGMWCHNKDFELNGPYKFSLDYEMTSQFDLEDGYLYVQCYADGGMAWFMFDEDNIKNMSGVEKDCAEYTINYLRDLEQAGIIEIPKS